MSLQRYVSLRKYWPTDEERAFFNREGYLVVEDALSPQMVERLTQAVDRCGHGSGGFHNRMDIFGLDDTFLELVDMPKVFAKICGFLGWNIWVNHTHYNIRPPDESDKAYNYMWHRDGGVFSLDLQDQVPMTAIKVGFYLSDLSETGRGNTYFIPLHLGASKKTSELEKEEKPPPEAVPLILKPGSAVMFQQRLLHSQGSPNLSDITRKTIFMQWAFRWLYPVDTMNLGDLPDRVTDPIRRQLLGLDKVQPGRQISHRYYPQDWHTPLKRKLLKEIGLAGLSQVGPATTRYLTRYLKFNFDAEEPGA